MKWKNWKVIQSGLILGYLVLDLFVFNGPLRRQIDSDKPNGEVIRKKAEQLNWVALVNGEEITRKQLDLAVEVHLYRRGKTAGESSEANLKILRRAVLQRLIDDTMVRTYALGEEFESPQETVDAYIRSFESQFEPGGLEDRSALQGLDADLRAEMLRQQVTQKLWLDKEIGEAIQVTEADARKWYDENRESGRGFQNPERLRVRHIFLSTVEKDRAEEIQKIRAQLNEEEAEFEKLAATFSDDERSKLWGGNLGWVARERLLDDFSKAVFALEIGTISEPFQTSIGWHIVEVMERKEATDLSFEELRGEIVSHLENEERSFQIQNLLKKRRKVAAIQVFPANL